VNPGRREFERNGWGSTSRSDVEHAGMRVNLDVPVSLSARPLKQASGDKWLNKEPINGRVWHIDQRKSSQIDLLIPELKQAVVDLQSLG
jgi:hypothetical protein